MIKKSILTKASLVIAITGLILLNYSLVPNSQAFKGIQQIENSEIIQEVVRKSYQIEADTAKSFNTSYFQTVFVNDPRGGELSPSTIRFIESIFQNSTQKNWGYLDYKLAYYYWWETGALKFEEIQSLAIHENRNLTEEEARSLLDEYGRLAMPRSQGNQIPIELTYLNIVIEGEVATIVLDDGPRTNQMTMVYIDGQWYIAGNKILSIHP